MIIDRNQTNANYGIVRGGLQEHRTDRIIIVQEDGTARHGTGAHAVITDALDGVIRLQTRLSVIVQVYGIVQHGMEPYVGRGTVPDLRKTLPN